MDYIADTHLHIYPFYEIELALQSLITNLNKLAPDAVKVGCLTERYDCDVYHQLASSPPDSVREKFNISSSDSGNCLKIESIQENDSVYLLPGQQIITSENLEILALNCIRRVKEGKDAAATITEVIQCGGIPVIAWGFGKWLGKRGRVVAKMLDLFEPDQLAVGDSTMRPYGWAKPILFRNAESKGYKILCGSDPLPFQSEAKRPGSFATRIASFSDTPDPETDFKYLISGRTRFNPTGKRNSIIEVLGRMRNHRETSKITASKT